MSRREQPYIPLYAMDFLTDEKLRECSAESVGVYIMLMCVMHKQEEYGTILLRQKDRQNENVITDFAVKLSKHLPFTAEVIERALEELIGEGVLQLNKDRLIQKRMVKDADLSQKRAKSGKKGAVKTNSVKEIAGEFAAAKRPANSENEIEYENEDEIKNKNENIQEKNIKSKGSKRNAYDKLIQEYTDNDKLKTAVYSFIEMRKSIKKPLTDYALKLTFGKLDKLADNDADKIKILNQSIVNCWQGVFELKNDGGGSLNGHNRQDNQSDYAGTAWE